MDINFKFEEVPVRRGGGKGRRADPREVEIAEQLKAQPGTSARVFELPEDSTKSGSTVERAGVIAYQIRTGKRAAFRDGFDAAARLDSDGRTGVVYVTYMENVNDTE